jgi:SAM-dependent methyltransferase
MSRAPGRRVARQPEDGIRGRDLDMVASDDRESWNARYARYQSHGPPSEWLSAQAEFLRPLSPAARALDAACGGGRNSLLLAELGCAVDAWDVSDVALAILSEELGRRAAQGAPLPVSVRCLDLKDATIPTNEYDLVLLMSFFHRPLIPRLAAALRPYGRLLIETRSRLVPKWRWNTEPEGGSVGPRFSRAYGGLVVEDYVEDSISGSTRVVARRLHATD